MPWTTRPQFTAEIKSGHRGASRKGAVYPWLPAIIDEKTLIEITTLESGERGFVSQRGRARRQYLSGLYLKAGVFWGIFILNPGNYPFSSGEK